MDNTINNPFGDNIFTEDRLNHYLKLYLKYEINECEKRIVSAKEVLNLEQCLPENYTLAQREYEVISYRKHFLQTQLDSMELVWDEDGTFI